MFTVLEGEIELTFRGASRRAQQPGLLQQLAEAKDGLGAGVLPFQ
jgi:hypothetical protein